MADLTREELEEFARLVRLATQHEPPPNPLTRIVDRQRLGEWCATRGGEGTVFLRLVEMAERSLDGRLSANASPDYDEPYNIETGRRR